MLTRPGADRLSGSLKCVTRMHYLSSIKLFHPVTFGLAKAFLIHRGSDSDHNPGEGPMRGRQCGAVFGESIWSLHKNIAKWGSCH